MAAKLTIAYWKEKVPEQDRQDARAAGEAINGGENGAPERVAASQQWAKTITSELIGDIESGKITLEQLSLMGTPPALADGILQPGERGPEVRNLQENLNKLGLTDMQGRAVAEDGHYAKQTREAVEAFQRQRGLLVDGVAGPNTLKAVQTYASFPNPLYEIEKLVGAISSQGSGTANQSRGIIRDRRVA